MNEKPKSFWTNVQYKYKKLLKEGNDWQPALKKALRYGHENFSNN